MSWSISPYCSQVLRREEENENGREIFPRSLFPGGESQRRRGWPDVLEATGHQVPVPFVTTQNCELQISKYVYGGFLQLAQTITLPSELFLLTRHTFLIRAICFIGWAIPFLRSHSCRLCLFASSPRGPLCTSEPKAGLASERSRVPHFNMTDYFKTMFSFPRKSFLKCTTLQWLDPAGNRHQGTPQQAREELTFLLLLKDKGGSGVARGLPPENRERPGSHIRWAVSGSAVTAGKANPTPIFIANGSRAGGQFLENSHAQLLKETPKFYPLHLCPKKKALKYLPQRIGSTWNQALHL